AVVGVEKDVLTPDPFDDLIAGDQLSTVFDEEKEKIHRNALEFQCAAGTTKLERANVELKIVAKINGLREASRFGGQVPVLRRERLPILLRTNWMATHLCECVWCGLWKKVYEIEA